MGNKIRVCTMLKPETIDKLSRIRSKVLSSAYHSGAICRVIDACVEQSDEVEVVKKMKGTK